MKVLSRKTSVIFSFSSYIRYGNDIYVFDKFPIIHILDTYGTPFSTPALYIVEGNISFVQIA